MHAGIDRRVTAAMLYAADRRESLAFHGEDPSLGAAAAVSA